MPRRVEPTPRRQTHAPSVNNKDCGIPGWAQINGRDKLPIPVKVGYDEYYLKNRTFSFDIKILFLTLFKTVKSEGVQH
jgi:O-antigen biosynthesis protein WbqP